jgi:ferritin-like metal-binding protein YciE
VVCLVKRLGEEEATDKTLTQLAQRSINVEAAAKA